ncbi:MAG: peptidase [bacterium]
MPKVLLLFCDGIGIAVDDPQINPFAKFRSPYFPLYQQNTTQSLPFDGIVIPIPADMGVPGLPQSATGQTALFCGIQSAKIVGRHISGFPTPTLRKLIDEHSIFRRLKENGLNGTFANALTKKYFERLGERISATTRAQQAGGFSPRMLEDLQKRKAVSHDLTNNFLRSRGYDVPVFTVEQCAGILKKILNGVDFCLFEFFLSDRAGHDQDFTAASDVIEKLQTLLATLLPQIDLAHTTVILTSDHGNMEDLSVKTHTRNPVPVSIWGERRDDLAHEISAIEEVAPAILSVLLR